MAKNKKSGKQQQAAQGKPAAGAKPPAPARPAAQEHRQQSKTTPNPVPARAPLPPLFTPVNLAALAAGLVLLGAGAFKFWSIQYGNAPTGARIYVTGFALFCAGVIIPCLGIAPLRAILLPRKQQEQSVDHESRGAK